MNLRVILALVSVFEKDPTFISDLQKALNEKTSTAWFAFVRNHLDTVEAVVKAFEVPNV